jgi:hypothetical protein
VAAAIALFAPLAHAVVPAGGEFPVNSFTAGTQRDPDVAVAAATGDFAVVWEDDQRRAGHTDTYLQRFRKDGTKLGPETLVSDSNSPEQLHLSRVAAMPDGELAVVWQAEESGPGSTAVYGRFYDANGAPVTAPLLLAPTRSHPTVAADPRGRYFLILFDVEGGGIEGRRYAPSGTPLDDFFTVTATGDLPDAAIDGAGRAIVVWQHFVNPSNVIAGRRFDANATPIGSELQISSTTALAHLNPRVSATLDGRFVVAWNRQESSFGSPNAVARVFKANAVPLGTEFPVGTSATRDQWNPDVAIDETGAFEVVWQTFGPTGESTDIVGQRFTAAGRRQGGIFRVSTFRGVQQDEPAIATEPNGPFVAVWQSVEQDGSGFGIFGRRFRNSSPTIDFGGNGDSDVAVFRPAEGRWLADFDFRPGGELNILYGRSGDVAVPKDYDGDGLTDLAVFRPASGTWFVDVNHNGGTDLKVLFGRSGDVPVPGDYDGDGRADLAVWEPSSGTWSVDFDRDGVADLTAVLGVNGDVPVPADYDGDGRTDFAIFHQGFWKIDTNHDGISNTSLVYGRGGDIPVPGDYDGDGRADLAVFRPSTATWFVDTNRNGGTDRRMVYGRTGDVPVAGDFDGDGVTDFAVYRPASTRWFVDTNRNGGTDVSLVFGAAGDVPLREGGWIRQALGLSP